MGGGSINDEAPNKQLEAAVEITNLDAAKQHVL